MLEHFKNVRLINLSADGGRSGLDLYFERTDNPPPADLEVEKLRRDYEVTIRVLRRSDLPDNQFTTLVSELVRGAEVGLKGPHYSLDSGRDQLNNVQNELLGRARRSRDDYLWKLFFIGGFIACAALVLAGVLYFIAPQFIQNSEINAAYKSALAWIVPLCLLFPGDVLGVVFIGMVANRTLTFDKITIFDPYYFSPALRFLYIAVVSCVLLLALWFKFVMLGIGGYLLNDVRTDPSAGLVIGLLCGVSEALVVELLLSKLKPVERGTAPG